MRMAFLEAGASNTNKLSLLMELLNGCATSVTHASPQAAHHLINSIGQRTFKWHAAFDTFWNQLFGVALEIAVAASFSHGGQAAHAAIYLKLTALVQLGISWGFFAASYQRADHHHAGAGSQCLDNIAGIFDAAVRNHWDAVFRAHASGVINRADLRHTDARYHTGGADGARANAYLDAV